MGSHLAWDNSRRFPRSPLEPSQNDVWVTSAEISYWWHVTTQILVVLLIGRKKIPTNQKHYQDLGSHAPSVWYFWRPRKTSAVFSGEFRPDWLKDRMFFSAELQRMLIVILRFPQYSGHLRFSSDYTTVPFFSRLTDGLVFRINSWFTVSVEAIG